MSGLSGIVFLFVPSALLFKYDSASSSVIFDIMFVCPPFKTALWSISLVEDVLPKPPHKVKE